MATAATSAYQQMKLNDRYGMPDGGAVRGQQLKLFYRHRDGWRPWGGARRRLVPCGVCGAEERPCECERPVWVSCAELRLLWERRPRRISLVELTRAVYPSQRSTTVARRLLGLPVDSRHGGRPQEKVHVKTAARMVEAMGYDLIDVGL